MRGRAGHAGGAPAAEPGGRSSVACLLISLIIGSSSLCTASAALEMPSCTARALRSLEIRICSSALPSAVRFALATLMIRGSLPPARFLITAASALTSYCRLCGFVFCDACTKFKRVLPEAYAEKGAVRVCGVCIKMQLGHLKRFAPSPEKMIALRSRALVNGGTFDDVEMEEVIKAEAQRGELEWRYQT